MSPTRGETEGKRRLPTVPGFVRATHVATNRRSYLRSFGPLGSKRPRSGVVGPNGDDLSQRVCVMLLPEELAVAGAAGFSAGVCNR